MPHLSQDRCGINMRASLAMFGKDTASLSSPRSQRSQALGGFREQHGSGYTLSNYFLGHMYGYLKVLVFSWRCAELVPIQH